MQKGAWQEQATGAWLPLSGDELRPYVGEAQGVSRGEQRSGVGGTHRALLLPALPTFCQVVFCFFFLLPALQKWQLSFSVSLYLSVRNLSPVHVPAATFVLYSFFAGEEVCPSAPQQRPGPRASRLQTPSKFRHLDLGQLACFITMEQ